EKGNGPGGRCNQLQLGDFTFDTGPTILLMPEVLAETFTAVGRRLEDYVELVRCDPNYRIHFRDGSGITFTSELTRMGQELERLEKGSYTRYLEFLALGQKQYRASLDRFCAQGFDHVWEYLAPGHLLGILESKAHRSLYSVVSGFFKDERLRAAMTFQTMYLGLSPYEAPAIFGLLPFSELGVGIWFARGGLYALPRGLEKLAVELGVKLRYGTPVKKIEVERGVARGVLLGSGERVRADSVLCNADLPWAYKNLLDPADTSLPQVERYRYTSSAFMLYLGTKKRFPQLLHHNVFFGRDYRGSFEDIFRRFRVPEDLSFYVCVPNRTDPSLSPEGKDSVYVLVPVPHRHPNVDWKREAARVRQRVFERLAEAGMPDLPHQLEVEAQVTPDDWESQLNLERGSIFGLAQNFFQVGPFRPPNQDPRVRNLFFVGASTQPGTGLPTVMRSAAIAAEKLAKHARGTKAGRSRSARTRQAREVNT
ncbi:MAG TPA: phytoene desaturase family protein, partial [Myxococcaceae bacterium]|nr:phytoene desaturase family protein [Myxococcaceae bacterium]